MNCQVLFVYPVINPFVNQACVDILNKVKSDGVKLHYTLWRLPAELCFAKTYCTNCDTALRYEIFKKN